MSDFCVCGEPIATCPHRGIFASAEEKAQHFAGKPARDADREAMAKLARDAGALRDRLRIAESAHGTAKALGARLPFDRELVDIADAVATFAPLVGYIPAINNNPTAKTALTVMVDAARLLLRVLTGR